MANMLLGISAVGTLKPSSFGIRRQVRKKKLMQSRRALSAAEPQPKQKISRKDLARRSRNQILCGSAGRGDHR